MMKSPELALGLHMANCRERAKKALGGRDRWDSHRTLPHCTLARTQLKVREYVALGLVCARPSKGRMQALSRVEQDMCTSRKHHDNLEFDHSMRQPLVRGGRYR